jgi:hypothetical protein
MPILQLDLGNWNIQWIMDFRIPSEWQHFHRASYGLHGQHPSNTCLRCNNYLAKHLEHQCQHSNCRYCWSLGYLAIHELVYWLQQRSLVLYRHQSDTTNQQLNLELRTSSNFRTRWLISLRRTAWRDCSCYITEHFIWWKLRLPTFSENISSLLIWTWLWCFELNQFLLVLRNLANRWKCHRFTLFNQLFWSRSLSWRFRYLLNFVVQCDKRNFLLQRHLLLLKY